MHRLTYISRAKQPLTDTELLSLLRQARLRNDRQQITGALVYGDQQFMQVLEGEQEVVQALYQRIARDARHQEIVKLCDEPIAQREFAEWAMGFWTLAPVELVRRTGYQAPHELLRKLPTLEGAEAILLDMMRQLLQAPVAG